jgi:hypothetical protein
MIFVELQSQGEMVKLSFDYTGKAPEEDMRLSRELFVSDRLRTAKVVGYRTTKNVYFLDLILHASFGAECHRHYALILVR